MYFCNEIMGKQKLPLLEKVEIIDAGSEGKAVARVDDKVIFVPFVVPGDLVDIRVIKRKKNYFEGRAVNIREYSPKRTEPRCQHFGVCGGCKWQNMEYSHQLFYKQKQVDDNFRRIGHLEYPPVRPILGCEDIFSYRNKLEYTFSNRRWFTDPPAGDRNERDNDALGFHIPGMFDRVLDIVTCHLQDNLSDKIRNAVREYVKKNEMSFYDVRTWEGLLRNLILRNTLSGDWMVIVVFGHRDEKNEGLLEFIQQNFREVVSLYYVINPKRNDDISDLDPELYHGVPYLLEEIPSYSDETKKMSFRIGPKSFFQTNTRQAFQLYRTAADFAALTGKEIVYDLYTGTGTIANYLSPHAASVVGIEYITEAILDARKNTEMNGISNTTFFAGDILEIMTDQFVAGHGRPDVIITDPPRAGMHPGVVDKIVETGPGKIVYVSCNPATQARDLALMTGRYHIRAVQPVDMFPHTQHVENVVLLERK